MKYLHFRRQDIIRAIRAACIALFLAACARQASAQTAPLITLPYVLVTPPNTYSTNAGLYAVTGTFYTPMAPATVTINAGTTIALTTASSGNGSGFGEPLSPFQDPLTNTGLAGGTFTNHGTDSVTLLASDNSTLSGVALFGSAGNDSTVVNSGGISATVVAGSTTVAGLSFDNSDFHVNLPSISASSFSVTNNGASAASLATISGTSGSGSAYGIHAVSFGTGSLTVNNGPFGSITAGSSGSVAYSNVVGILLNQTEVAPSLVNNSGAVAATSTSGYAAGISSSAYGNGTGTMTINNTASGMITVTGASATGMAAHGGQGDATITNDGTLLVTATGDGATAQGLFVNGTGGVTATNTGSITTTTTTGSSKGIFATNLNFDGPVTISNSIVTNPETDAIIRTGTISVTGLTTSSGIYALNQGGTALVTNDGTISTTVTGTGTAYGIEALGEVPMGVGIVGPAFVAEGIVPAAIPGANGPGPITIHNTGGVTALNTGTGSSYGIAAASQGNVVITNGGANASITSTSGSYSAYGISATTGGTITLTNSSTGSIQATGNVNSAGIYALVESDAATTSITNDGSIHSTPTGLGGTAYGIQAFTGTIQEDGTTMSADYAAPITIHNTGGVTALNTGTGNSFGISATNAADLVITSGGDGAAITSTSDTGSASGIYAGSYGGTVSVTNSSAITVTATTATMAGTGIRALDSNFLVGVTNTGTITVDGANGTGIFAGDDNAVATVTNSGTIDARATTGSGFGIFDQVENVGSTVINSGMVTGQTASGLYAVGVRVEGATSESLINELGGTIRGIAAGTGTASGVYTNSSVTEVPTTIADITNNGVISGQSAGGTAYGVQALQIGNDTGPLTIINTHTIEASSTTGSSYGVFANAVNLVVLHNNGGTISGGTFGVDFINGTANDVITNTGTISSSAGEGLVDDSTGNITLTNTRGTITGANGHALTLGSGNNMVNIVGDSTITGLMDGGIGAVTIGQKDNTLAFSQIVLTDAQKTEFALVASEAAADPGGDYFVTLGPDTYNFTDFNFVLDNFLSQFPTGGLTPNQGAVLGPINIGLGAGNPNAGFTSLINVLTPFTTNPALLGAALDQLSPEEFHRFTSETAFNNSSFEIEAMDNYLSGLRDANGNFLARNGGIDSSGLTLNDPNYDSNLAQVHSRMLAWSPAPIANGLLSDTGTPVLGGTDRRDSKDMKSVSSAPAYTDPWNFFIRGSVILAQGFSQIDVGHFDDNT